MNLSASLRKVAVLISALDESDAEAILVQMGPEESAKVRSAMVELDEISSEEQTRVLAEFMRHRAGPPQADNEEGGVNLELNPEVEARAAEDSFGPPNSMPAIASPFEFLERVEPAALASVLSGEQPQIVAAVLAQLSPHQAAAMLERLPAELATDALERTALLDELSLEVKSDLADELRSRLAPYLRASDAGPAHVAHVSAVLEAMDERRRQSAVKHLAARNRPLSRRLGIFEAIPNEPLPENSSSFAFRYRLDSTGPLSPRDCAQSAAATSVAVEEGGLRFQDMALLNAADLRAVFAHSDAETILLALTGAESRLLDRILRHLPGRDALVLRRQLDNPGPIRLSEIEHARTALLRTMQQLARQGHISVPNTNRISAAM
jgi:flagellar motor switch protein FliG